MSKEEENRLMNDDEEEEEKSKIQPRCCGGCQNKKWLLGLVRVFDANTYAALVLTLVPLFLQVAKGSFANAPIVLPLTRKLLFSRVPRCNSPRRNSLFAVATLFCLLTSF